MSEWELKAVADQSRRSFGVASKVRLVAAGVFAPLVGVLAARGEPGWVETLIFVVPYSLLALVLSAWPQRLWTQRLGPFSFLLDVAMIFALQWHSLPTSPFPAGVAGFTLGLFVLIVVLAGASFRASATWATAALATPLQLILMQEAGVGLGAQLSAGVVLLAAALAQNRLTRRLVSMVRAAAAHEIAHHVETERVEKLEEANSTITRLLEEAQRNATRLEALQKEKEVLTSLLVHDLRAPLSAIKSNLEYLEDEVRPLKDPDVSQAVVDCIQVTNRLSAMIGDMLNVTRLETGSFDLRPEEIDAKPFLDRILRTFAGDARVRRLAIRVEADEFTFSGDAQLLQRTIENLTSNALRYTPADGRVQLEARLDGRDVVLAVRNDGPPIAHHLRATLFDKFVQGADAGSARRSGWGLGLYFCKMCIEQHGGRISIEDAPGWPTTFSMRLPGAAVSAAAHAA